ncbi:MAG TPA: hypothetical protein VEU77_04545 [Candidatus Acidoferrales bacterium]|nr:hypothetical protein [Candidatus Acidoferrales bacterium]
MIRCALLLTIVLAAACAPAASAPSATPGATPSSAAPATSPATATPTTAPTVTPTPIPLPTFAYVAAAGNGVVWVFVNGDHLFRSTDRGDTWSQRTLPQPTVPNGRIAFVSAQDGWLMSVGSPATQCSGQSVTLWRTTDGAATWSQVNPTGIDNAQCKDTISFVDAQRGYIGASDPNTQPHIYRTVDGGKTWSSSTLPNPPAQRPAAFADFGSVVLASAESGAAPDRYYTFRSTNGGSSWTGASAGPIEAMPIVFVTATRWLQIIGSQSQETTDGGASWHAYTTDYQQAAPVAPQIAFGDAMTGYATVRGSLERTLDGGAHWGAIKTPGT